MSTLTKIIFFIKLKLLDFIIAFMNLKEWKHCHFKLRANFVTGKSKKECVSPNTES